MLNFSKIIKFMKALCISYLEYIPIVGNMFQAYREAKKEEKEEILEERLNHIHNKMVETSRIINTIPDPFTSSARIRNPEKRASCTGIKFVGTNSNGKGYSIFLIAKSLVILGRAEEDAEQKRHSDIIIRRLPCTTEKDTPDNWNKTTTISKVHCQLEVEQDDVFLKDLSSTFGTHVEGKKIISSIVLKDPYTKISLGNNAILLGIEIIRHSFKENTQKNTEPVDCICIYRLDNLPEHVYIILLKNSNIQHSSIQNTVSLPWQLFYREGEFFLGSNTGGISYQGLLLDANEFLALSPGVSFTSSDSTWEVQPMILEDFKKISRTFD